MNGITTSSHLQPTLRHLRIISGGQTGADRAGLDVALRRGIPHGGWCPRGRLAEDGPLSARYQLTETSTANYLVRTEMNAARSDATVILTLGPLRGGSKRTAGFAARHRRPFLHLNLSSGDTSSAAEALASFVSAHQVRILNVAGSRESKAPGIHAAVVEVMDAALDLLETAAPFGTTGG